jgi:aryl-alcohol dehydrogenase-like predicted oxidoreductase
MLAPERRHFTDSPGRTMDIQPLRGIGTHVSRVSLGTMTFGQQADEATSRQIIDMALDGGVTFVDCADVYTKGASEEIVGRALQGRRDGIVLASKVGNRVGPDAHLDAGLHRGHVLRAVERSLARLQTDRLDLLYMHRPDPHTPMEETLAAFDQLVRDGKVLYVGMSNHAAWQVGDARWLARQAGQTLPTVLQVPYNPIARSIDEECVAFARAHGLSLVVYNPLAGGLLTGKHDRGAEPAAGTRFALNAMYRDRFWSEPHFDAVERLGKVAGDAGLTLPQLAFRWLMSQPHVDSVILGVSKPEHLEQNLAACEGRLDEATLAACDEVWQRLRGPHFRYNR